MTRVINKSSIAEIHCLDNRDTVAKVNSKLTLDNEFKVLMIGNVRKNMTTLLDIRNQIISVLCEKSVFDKNDIENIKIPKELVENKYGIIISALSQLEELGILSKVGVSLWILNHPIGSSGQEIKISLITSNNIAETINTFLKAQGDTETPRADSLNLNEGHIITLLQILDAILMDKDDGDEDKDEKESGVN